MRARKGQATESHSLAERMSFLSSAEFEFLDASALEIPILGNNFESDCLSQARREKISERMKIIQDLVSGCNKFLSLKLEAVGSRTKVNPSMEAFPSKELRTAPFDATGMMFASQAMRAYIQGSHTEWLPLQM